MEEASRLVKEKFPSITVIPLNVSAPFHSSLMRGIESEFEGYLRRFSESFDLQKATAVISNFSGTFHTPEKMIENLVRQISGSVRWQQNMEVLAGASSDIVEVGPNRVLAKFLSTIDVTARAVTDERSLKKAFGERSAVAA